MNRLKEIIEKECIPKRDPVGSDYRSLSTRSVAAMAADSGRSLREIETAALQAGIVPERYQRNMGTMGVEGQLKLLNSAVAVIGAGGLGGCIIELLARAGVGRLTVIDPDLFADSNLNRQILSDMGALGMAKVDVAARRVAAINPAVAVTTHAVAADESNFSSMIDGCQMVVDALDNIGTRKRLAKVAQKAGIPFVHGAIAGFFGQVTTIFPADAGLEAIYGDGGDDGPGIEQTIGTPGMTPFLVASLQVAEVVRILLAWPRPLKNKLLIMDLKKMVFDKIEFSGIQSKNADT